MVCVCVWFSVGVLCITEWTVIGYVGRVVVLIYIDLNYELERFGTG